MNFTDFSWVSDPKAWVGLLTLTFLQIILGVDNIVLLTILSGQLPSDQQKQARKLGLIAAMASRLILLVALLWISHLLNKPLLHWPAELSGKDLILLGGGGFLITKATMEIHAKMEGDEEGGDFRAAPTLMAVLIQLFVLDVVFSLDSVITALGLINIVPIQIAAVVLATLFMMVGINSVANFIDKHPSLKMLALSFLVLIGVNLILEALNIKIPKEYTYFAMAWSIVVEMLNIRVRKSRKARKAAPVCEPDQALEPGS